MHAGNYAAKFDLGVKIRVQQRFKALDSDNYPRITFDLKAQIEGRLNRLIRCLRRRRGLSAMLAAKSW